VGTALGVDVGLAKGLDIVLLQDDLRVGYIKRRVRVSELADEVSHLRPDIVAIDSPPAWAPVGGRATERFLRKMNLQLYATPTEDRQSKKGFHDWMLVGMQAFASISPDYPLFDGNAYNLSSIEVFPHASAVVLAGHLRPNDWEKTQWRRKVLEEHNVASTDLTSPDLVDAGLAALTGLRALGGRACWFGNPNEGVIVLPSDSATVLSKYGPHLAKVEASALSPKVCSQCMYANPPIAKFCNQCGSRLKLD